jgi:hypothetical protein
VPVLNEVAASGGPMTTPSLKAMLKAWGVVTKVADPHLDELDEAAMRVRTLLWWLVPDRSHTGP